jgi:glycosyltransferase involved in cell wall biosynthesis
MKKYQKLLTIAIPTFNRNLILRENILRILDIADEWIDILIIDNSSMIPVYDTIKDIIEINDNISIIRNSYNIGCNANILRCIENAESEYLWILGDDDIPNKNALNKIYEKISSRDPLWVNFYSNDQWQPYRHKERKVESLVTFLTKLESISELVFMSTNIYKLNCIKEGLEYGYMYQEMMAPHLISMISGIQNSGLNGSYIISQDILFEVISKNQDESTAWPLYKAFIGITALHRIPFEKRINDALDKLVRGARRGWLCNRNMILGFSLLSAKNGPKKAFLLSSSFIVSIIIIDRLKFFITYPIYLISIICGRYIIKIKYD